MPQELTTETPREILLRTAKELGLSMTAEFVPWSQSRYKDEKAPSLNWKVTLLRGDLGQKGEGGRVILTTDYMAGSAYCPGYNSRDMAFERTGLIKWECEHGHAGYMLHSLNHISKKNKNPIEPDLADVLYSLVMDASVLDHKDFESWASEFGYDADSRTAEKTYHACLDIALKLRNGLGEEGLAQLREACQDY